MEYLHTQKPPVLHRESSIAAVLHAMLGSDCCVADAGDLKTPNLLLSEDLRVKITDFGLSREKLISHGKTAQMTVCGTPLWTAPEVLKGESYNEKADVFSFSLCLWELWSNVLPHSELGLGPMEIVLKVASEDIRPRIPADMPHWMANVVQRCWVSYT